MYADESGGMLPSMWMAASTSPRFMAISLLAMTTRTSSDVPANSCIASVTSFVASGMCSSLV